MTKFQKIQIYSSIIPFWSTFVIAIISMIEMKRHKASAKIWGYYILTLFVSVPIVSFVNQISRYSLLSIAISGLLLVVTNVLLVRLQVKSKTV